MIDLQHIRQNNPIENFIAVNKRRAWCPFCQPGEGNANHAPALAVYPDEHWHCFGCGEGGDVIELIMRLEKLDFRAACRQLGAQNWQPTVAEIQQRTQERLAAKAQAEAERRAELDRRLADFTSHEVWEAYHRLLEKEQRAWWRTQGIPDEWQDYLSLGFEPHKKYYSHDGQAILDSPAYTIPYFHHQDGQRKFVTLQYRLANPERPADRYRFESGLGSPYYHVIATEPIMAWLVICEGAKKAMVAHILGGLENKVTILAVPGKNSWKSSGIISLAQQAAGCFICLDPDAYSESLSLARQIGKQARVVSLPRKVDDMFVQDGMTARVWQAALRQARKVGTR